MFAVLSFDEQTWNGAPPLPAFDGVPFFVQAAVLSSGSNAAGIVVSNSGRAVLGAL